MRTLNDPVPDVVRIAAWLYVMRRAAIEVLVLAIIGLAGFMVVAALALNVLQGPDA